MHLAGQCGVSRGVCLIAEERVAAWLPRSGSLPGYRGAGRCLVAEERVGRGRTRARRGLVAEERVAAWLPKSGSVLGRPRAAAGACGALRAVALIGGPWRHSAAYCRGALDGLRAAGLIGLCACVSAVSRSAGAVQPRRARVCVLRRIFAPRVAPSPFSALRRRDAQKRAASRSPCARACLAVPVSPGPRSPAVLGQ